MLRLQLSGLPYPSFERPVFQLIHKPYLAIVADTIVPQFVNGIWLSERVVSIGDSVYIRPVNPGQPNHILSH